MQAYTQTLLLGDETWIFLPEHMRLTAWKDKYKNPVVPLRLALYGHPVSGAYCERHCQKILIKVGIRPVPELELDLQLQP